MRTEVNKHQEAAVHLCKHAACLMDTNILSREGAKAMGVCGGGEAFRPLCAFQAVNSALLFFHPAIFLHLGPIHACYH